MTASTSLGSRHGLDLFRNDRGEILAWRGSDCVGHAFPKFTNDPEGLWFGRLRGQTAQLFRTRHKALAYVLGGCPDCLCEPALCRGDDSGQYCELVNCGACLHGCPEDECGMRRD